MLPESFTRRVMAELGPEEGRALCEALEGPAPTSVRLHPQRPCRWSGAEAVPWSPAGRYLTERPSFTLDPAFHAGAYYVQEASSQFLAHVLAGEEVAGKRILDLCAAPGGKTTLYASLAGSDGLVVANEVNRQRAAVLADNVRKWGLGNVAVTVNEPAQIAVLEGWFDIVAVDAPCSGEGMFRKEPVARQQHCEALVKQCAELGAEILDCAAAVLAPGGQLVYSTCTFAPEEDEGAIGAFLQRHPDFHVVEADMPWLAPGRPEWAEQPNPELRYTFRLWPHLLSGEGHFAALLKKDGDAAPAELPKPAEIKMPAELMEFLDRMDVTLPEGRLISFGPSIYLCPADMPELKGLKVLRPGLELGQAKKGRFEPAHALALWLGTAAVTENLSATDPRVLDYLQGQVIPGTANGWTLITVDGRLESRKYTDKDGNNRVAIEIIADNVYFGESKSTAQYPEEAAGSAENFSPDFAAFQSSEEGDDFLDDDFIPF